MYDASFHAFAINIHPHTHTHTQSLGQLGRFSLLMDEGSAVVRVNGRRWIMDPLCLLSAPEEQPEDEQSNRLCVCLFKFVNSL